MNIENIEEYIQLLAALGALGAAFAAYLSVVQMRKQAALQVMPRIVLMKQSFEITKVPMRDQNWKFSIANIGNGPAIDVEVEWDYSAILQRADKQNNIVDQDLSDGQFPQFIKFTDKDWGTNLYNSNLNFEFEFLPSGSSESKEAPSLLPYLTCKIISEDFDGYMNENPYYFAIIRYKDLSGNEYLNHYKITPTLARYAPSEGPIGTGHGILKSERTLDWFS